MEITLKAIIQAVPALNKLADGDLPLPLAYKLSKTLKSLQEEIDFFNDERAKVIAKHGGELRRDRIVFRDAEGAGELEKILDLTVNPDVEKIVAPIFENIRLSAHDVTALEPFVEFVEVDDG